MSWPSLAAITLDSKGGGVAVASRLMWQAFRDHWGDGCHLVTLFGGNGRVPALESTTATKLRFGTRLAKEQVLGQCRWVLYSHLSLARVQTFVPAPFRRPYAVFLHGIEAWRPLSPAQRQILQGAALLVANSRYTAHRVAQAHPWIDAIEECPLALPASDASAVAPPARPAFGGARPSTVGAHLGAVRADPDIAVDIGPRAVLVVARMLSTERYKGHDELLEAWPAVAARIPDARLVFAGAGDDVPRLEARAGELGLGRSVIFTGFLSEPALTSLYQRAALFAMPSRDEGFGLVYLEAMAQRLPCIGSIHDAAGDVIEDGVTGFLVPQSDIASITDRIIRLLEDRAERAEMGARGYARLTERFGYEKFRDRLLSLMLASFGGLEPRERGRPASSRLPSRVSSAS